MPLLGDEALALLADLHGLECLPDVGALLAHVADWRPNADV
jgi:hypothetical protein